MPRIPTRDNLRQGVPRPTGGIVSAPRDFIGPAIQRTGKKLFDVAKKQAAEEQQQEKARQQQSALELATARARWNSNLLAEQKAYTPEQNPDYGNWSRTYKTRATVLQKQAARTIADPGVRQRFMAETQDDLERGGINLDRQAREAGMDARRTEAEESLQQQVDNAASLPDEDAKTIMGGVRATLQDMADTGIISVEDAAARSVAYAQRYASLKITELARQDPVLAVSVLSDEEPGPAGLIRQLHGFRSRPYWHGDTSHTGYGSDTITREDGTVANITPGMTVARADAERDLQRRVDEARAGVSGQVGAGAFGRLQSHVQAALVSVGYGTGTLPDKVAEAVRSGDAEAIAAAIEAEADEAGSINQKVRREEAAIVRGEDNSAYRQIARRPLWAGVLEQEQKPALLDAVSHQVKRLDRKQALADRTYARQLEQGIRSNFRSVFSAGIPIQLDPDAVLRELGPENFRRWGESAQDAAEVTAETQDLPSLPDDQIIQLVESRKPGPDTENFARRQAVHERISRRANEIRRERRDNPARAAVRVQAVRNALSQALDPGVTSPQKVQALVGEMMATQSALGVPGDKIAPVPDQWAFEIGKTLVGALTRLDRSNAVKMAPAIRRIHAGLREQYGEFTGDVIAYSIGRAKALSGSVAYHLGDRMNPTGVSNTL